MPQQDGLEYINAHQPPCGCLFLIAWQETRRRHARGHLVDTHDDAKHGARTYRVVDQAEAETIVNRKRAHDHWAGHVVGPGNQPPPALCPVHERLGYSDATYAAVVAEHAAAIEDA